MSNQHGYAVIQTDVPGTWIADGYVSIGASGAPSYTLQPSGIVSGFTRVSTGLYTLNLAQPWYALQFIGIHSEIPSSLSPAYVTCQLVSDTVGVAASPVITFQFNVAGSATDLPSGSGFRFLLILKQSSA